MEKVSASDFVEAVANYLSAPKKQVKETLEAVVSQIEAATLSGRAVSISGLGTFKPVDRAAKTGRNPKTGETIKIPARRVLVFRPSSKIDLNVI